MGHRQNRHHAVVYQLRPVREIAAYERLAQAVPIADLVTLARKRASGKPVGTFVGTHSGTDGETQAKTDIDGKLGRITELR